METELKVCQTCKGDKELASLKNVRVEGAKNKHRIATHICKPCQGTGIDINLHDEYRVDDFMIMDKAYVHDTKKVLLFKVPVGSHLLFDDGTKFVREANACHILNDSRRVYYEISDFHPKVESFMFVKGFGMAPEGRERLVDIESQVEKDGLELV